MKIKNLIGTLLGLMLSVSMLAQSNPGIDLLRLGELDLAKQYFMRTMRQMPNESHYYLGEIAWAEGNKEEAKKEYASAMSSNPESLYSQVGAAKSELANDPKEAKKTLETLVKKNKKDVQLILEVARAFYDNGMEEDGNKAVSEARKGDKSSPLIYILEGDRFLKQKRTGDAAMQYDQAINFDNKSVLAYIKGGKVYEGINPGIAIDQYKKAMEIDPSNTLVTRYLAKVYSMSGRYNDAIGIYSKYFEGNNYNVEDIAYYARALYFNKDYAKAREILQEGVTRDPENFVFHRLLMYSDNELKSYDTGIVTADKFFTLRSDSGYIDQDYMAYGHLLNENQRPEEALQAYEKAIEINPSNIGLYKELAASLAGDRMNEDAAKFMATYVEKAGDQVEATDYYQLGRYYQSAATALRDSLPETIAKRTEFLKKADASFETVTERLPENYLGYYMRASANSLLDPDLTEGLAKPFYEKTIEIIKGNDELEARKSIVLTAYEYLAVYYFYQHEDTKDKEAKIKATEYCDLYTQINPDRESINAIKEALNQ